MSYMEPWPKPTANERIERLEVEVNKLSQAAKLMVTVGKLQSKRITELNERINDLEMAVSTLSEMVKLVNKDWWDKRDNEMSDD